ncbi:uncharacterized protein [Coffea arabica]|uniref:Uncharacterized protein isoform X1 n=1 Tax=Coffea arabica TaxID=13443 RepID=A0ABM4UXU0_COFAR
MPYVYSTSAASPTSCSSNCSTHLSSHSNDYQLCVENYQTFGGCLLNQRPNLVGMKKIIASQPATSIGNNWKRQMETIRTSNCQGAASSTTLHPDYVEKNSNMQLCAVGL